MPVVTLPEYLRLVEGRAWTHEDTDWVLRHVREIERTIPALVSEALKKPEKGMLRVE